MVKVGELEYTAFYHNGRKDNLVQAGWYPCRLLDGEVLDYTLVRFDNKEEAEAYSQKRAIFDASFV